MCDERDQIRLRVLLQRTQEFVGFLTQKEMFPRTPALPVPTFTGSSNIDWFLEQQELLDRRDAVILETREALVAIPRLRPRRTRKAVAS